uniref:C2H2-type domain-containing protein n=1 Tax=Ananas comosus var. bracteatus TaxID=296719 RepID=A0A6V7P9D5_ANACO|nr:unnamed protein product [Ananas comosus var. bracteatus]
MPVLTCNACNKEFEDEGEQKLHYRSEWHRYNLKRKVAGVPGVTEALFQARQLALAEERNKFSPTPMLYSCALCGKEYRSSKAHAQHMKSRAHVMKASQESTASTAGITVIKPLIDCVPHKSALLTKAQLVREDYRESEENEDEWVEVDPDEEVDMVYESLSNLHVDEHASNADGDMDEIEKLDPSLSRGLLTYVGLKVKRDFTCLYCNERCHPFQSLEAVRKHMAAKSHCKLRYGDGGDDEDADLEEFYDYSCSYIDADGKQLVAANDMANSIELGSGGSELVITHKTENGTLVRTLGSREFLRYYRQKPRPSLPRDVALAVSLASRYRSMGLATVQSKEPIIRMKVLKEMNRSGVEAMRSKFGMKSNVIRNLPKNVPY